LPPKLMEPIRVSRCNIYGLDVSVNDMENSSCSAESAIKRRKISHDDGLPFGTMRRGMDECCLRGGSGWEWCHIILLVEEENPLLPSYLTSGDS